MAIIGEPVNVGPCGCCGRPPPGFCAACPAARQSKYFTAVVAGSSNPYFPNGTYFFSVCHNAYTDADINAPPYTGDPGNLVPNPYCQCACFYNGFYSATGSAPWTPLVGEGMAGVNTLQGAIGGKGYTWEALRHVVNVGGSKAAYVFDTADPAASQTFCTAGGTFTLSGVITGQDPPTITLVPSGGVISCSPGLVELEAGGFHRLEDGGRMVLEGATVTAAAAGPRSLPVVGSVLNA